MSTHQETYRGKNKAGKRDEDCWRKCSCEEVKKGGSCEEIKDIKEIKGCEEVKNCEELFLRRDQRLRRDRFLRRDQVVKSSRNRKKIKAGESDEEFMYSSLQSNRSGQPIGDQDLYIYPQEIYWMSTHQETSLIRLSRSNKFMINTTQLVKYLNLISFRPTHQVARRLVYLPIKRYTRMSTHQETSFKCPKPRVIRR